MEYSVQIGIPQGKDYDLFLNRDSGYRILDFKYFRINLGRDLVEAAVQLVGIALFLPGVIVHELGHILGGVVSRYLYETRGIQSVKLSYWGAPILNLFLAGVLLPLSGVTGSENLLYVAAANLGAGTVLSDHDWFFEEGYTEEDKEQNWNSLFGEEDDG